MRVKVVLCLLLATFQLYLSFKPTTSRISRRSPHSITNTTNNRLHLSLSEETMIYAQGAVNCAVVVTLCVALHFKEKDFQATLAKQNKDLEDSLATNAKINDEKRVANWKNFEETIQRQDIAYKNQMAELEKTYNNNFGYTNLKRMKD